MLGISFVTLPADMEERRRPTEPPFRYVERLAREKVRLPARSHPDALIIGGDTVAVMAGRVLEKPRDETEASEMLNALSGNVHQVFSGLALAREGECVSGVATARVLFRPLAPALIEDYVESGEPLDKAAAYGIMGYGSALVERIEGDYYAVVGLSVFTLFDLLPDLGLQYAPGRIKRLGR